MIVRRADGMEDDPRNCVGRKQLEYIGRIVKDRRSGRYAYMLLLA